LYLLIEQSAFSFVLKTHLTPMIFLSKDIMACARFGFDVSFILNKETIFISRIFFY